MTPPRPMNSQQPDTIFAEIPFKQFEIIVDNLSSTCIPADRARPMRFIYSNIVTARPNIKQNPGYPTLFNINILKQALAQI